MQSDAVNRSKRRGLVAATIALLRPKQYQKNTFVFAAILFSNTFRDHTAQIHALLAFVAMCMASSATYIVNDAFDVERDRLHPKKKFRPLAAGELSLPFATVLAAVLLVGSLAIATSLNIESLWILLTYLGLQVAYNGGLKKQPIADVFTIATGFVLRAVLGATAIPVVISAWLLFFTGALALTLGFAKRRNEFILQNDDRASSRESLAHYTKQTLDLFVAIFGTSAALLYAIYSIESKTGKQYPFLPATVPFVVYGITRYLLLTLTKDEGGEPADLIVKDPHLIVSILGFVLTAMIALSGFHLQFLER